MQGRKPSFQPTLECLEERSLLAAHLTASLSGGLLRIEGTARADTIVVREIHNHISVDGIDIKVGGREQASVAAASVRRITIYGNGGNDRIFLNSEATHGQQPLRMPVAVWGGAGNDLIVGGAGAEQLHGGNGNDTIYAGSGTDLLDGGNGNDILVGGRGTDILNAGSGNDRLYAGSGNDTLDGGVGRNLFVGGRGTDVFFSHNPRDTIELGSGRNTVHRLYEASHGSGGPIRGLDFSPPPHPAPQPAPHPAPAPVPASPFQAEVDQVIALTNAYRVANGLNTLTVNAKLTASAQYQSSYMAATGDYSHVNLDGRNLGDRVNAAGYAFAWTGENIHLYDPSIGRTLGIDQFYPPSELAQYYFDGWRVSPEHNANLLAANAVDVGVAIAQSPTGLLYATMDLGRLG